MGMNQKKNRKIFMLLVIAGAFSLHGCGKAQNLPQPSQTEAAAEHYEYPEELTGMSVAQKIEQCRIPEEILAEMTVEQLVWAVIDFPFLVVAGTGATSDWKGGLDALKKESDAFVSLTERDAPEEEIISALKAAWETDAENESDPDILVRVELAQEVFYHSQGEYFSFDKEELEFLSGQ